MNNNNVDREKSLDRSFDLFKHLTTLNFAFLVLIGPVYRHFYKLPIIPDLIIWAVIFSILSLISCLFGMFIITVIPKEGFPIKIWIGN